MFKSIALRLTQNLCLGLILFLMTGCQTTSLEVASGGSLKIDGPSARLDAWMREPEGVGPFPAVVLMHGCAGWHGGRIRDWADWFVERGWVALALDSLSARNIHSNALCKNSRKVKPLQRALDAFGGLDFLASNPNVDPDRIIVMGFSHGGSTVLRAMSETLVDFERTEAQPRFRAGVALYPFCGAMDHVYAPTTIIIGDKDDWTFATDCKYARQYDEELMAIELNIIEGAYHSFDNFSWKGRPVKPRSYLGHYLVPSRPATNEARRIVAEFLERNR
jgi:dienelactone hydrolase